MDTSSATAPPSASLRPYQRIAVDLLTAELTRNSRAHLALPTGSGKSRILGELAHLTLTDAPEPDPGTVLLVTPRRQITAQLGHAMAAATGLHVTTLPAPDEDSTAGPIIVGGADTLWRWARRNAARPQLIMVDEAHHATAKGCRRLLDAYPDANRVGVTATPYRHDGERLDQVLGRCVMVRDPDSPDMIGVLAPVTWLPVTLPVDLRQVPTSRTDHGPDYVAGRLGAVLTTPAAIDATVDGTSDPIRDRPTVAFAATVEQGRALAAAYRAAGHQVGEIYGDTPRDERARLIEALTRWPTHPDGLGILVSVGALTEGFDCPPVAALVIARPTRSELLYTQMMGRGLRMHPGKVDCLVLDITDAEGTAAPTSTGQVFAPTVLNSTTPPDASGDGDLDHDDTGGSDWWSPSRRQVRQIIGTDRRSPTWSWSPGPDGMFIVPLADGQVGILFPDGESGLWSPLISERCSGAITTLADPLPVRHAVDLFAGMADRHLTRANRRWRSHPATDSQLATLERWDPAIADQAISGGWSKGHVGDVIGALIASRKITTVGGYQDDTIPVSPDTDTRVWDMSIGDPVSPELREASRSAPKHLFHTNSDLGTPSEMRKVWA